MVQQYDSKLSKIGLDNPGTDLSNPLAGKKSALGDSQNENRSMVPKSTESSMLLENTGLPIKSKVTGMKRPQEECPVAASSYQTSERKASVHLVYSRRKSGTGLGKRTTDGNTSVAADNIQSVKQGDETEQIHPLPHSKDFTFSTSEADPVPRDFTFSTSEADTVPRDSLKGFTSEKPPAPLSHEKSNSSSFTSPKCIEAVLANPSADNSKKLNVQHLDSTPMPSSGGLPKEKPPDPPSLEKSNSTSFPTSPNYTQVVPANLSLDHRNRSNFVDLESMPSGSSESLPLKKPPAPVSFEKSNSNSMPSSSIGAVPANPFADHSKRSNVQPLESIPRVSSQGLPPEKPPAAPSLGKSNNGSLPTSTNYIEAFPANRSMDHTKRSSVQHMEERFSRLQTKLEALESNQKDYLQMLRSLSSVDLSRVAVELERKSIQLSLEEAKEVQRVRRIDVLGNNQRSK